MVSWGHTHLYCPLPLLLFIEFMFLSLSLSPGTTQKALGIVLLVLLRRDCGMLCQDLSLIDIDDTGEEHVYIKSGETAGK